MGIGRTQVSGSGSADALKALMGRTRLACPFGDWHEPGGEKEYSSALVALTSGDPDEGRPGW